MLSAHDSSLQDHTCRNDPVVTEHMIRAVPYAVSLLLKHPATLHLGRLWERHLLPPPSVQLWAPQTPVPPLLPEPDQASLKGQACRGSLRPFGLHYLWCPAQTLADPAD